MMILHKFFSSIYSKRRSKAAVCVFFSVILNLIFITAAGFLIYRYLNDFNNIIVSLICFAVIALMNILLLLFNYLSFHRAIDEVVADMDSINDYSNLMKKKDYKNEEIDHLASRLSNLLERLKDVSRENYEIQLSMRSAKLNTLIAQLNPHFLFNALQLLQNEIVNGSRQDSNLILLALSNLFRYSSTKLDAFVRIEDEVKFTKDYLAICKKTYDDNLTVELDIDDQILGYSTPKFVLQPLVENSIKHGFAGAPYRNHIYIRGKSNGNNIVFIVEDDGCGISAGKLEDIRRDLAADLGLVEGSGIGLKNINQRIKILLGEQYGLNVESEENSFTRFTLTITKIGDGMPRPYGAGRKPSEM